MNEVNLGDKVRDRVTGFTGIVVGISHFLYGCAHCGVRSQDLHDGKPIDTKWFDAPQLEVLEAGAIKADNVTQDGDSKQDTGGPMLSTPPGREKPE